LYAAKEMNPKKPLSILVSSFKEINQYTSGFSVTSNEPGAPNWFNVVKRLLPGPVRTFILWGMAILFADTDVYGKK
jgi:tRNA A37 threonylcarbamoyladenosine synthetase subunit TsaC/SUA5/YrdC